MTHPPIFIINMDGCETRWHQTYARLKKIGLDASRFPATNGKRLSEEELAMWYDQAENIQRYHRHLTPGEIGCYVSHYQVFEKVVKENLEFALILEDDLNIDANLTQILDHVCRLENWDMIKLADARDYPFVESVKLDEKFTVGNYKKVPNSALGYLISLQGAKKLLQRKPFFRPVDVDFQFHGELGLRIVGIKPYPISEDVSFGSEIENINQGRHSNRSTFFRNFKHRVRMYIQRQSRSADLKKIILDE